METTNLYIPVNIRTRFEFFDGYGMAELMPTLGIAAGSGFIAVLIHAATGSTISAILLVLVSIAAAVMALAKGEGNMSMVNHIQCILRFMREQRRYEYVYESDSDYVNGYKHGNAHHYSFREGSAGH